MRFVIITVPPPAMAQALDDFRRPWNTRMGVDEALRYPPHITLRTGLVCPDDRAETLALAFLDHASGLSSVPVQTQGLFFTPLEGGGDQALVGWSIAPQPELHRLHRELLEFRDGAKGPQGPFRPHVSLVYGPIGPFLETLRQGLEAGPEVPDFAWTIDHVALYHERPEGWVEWGRTRLKSSDPC